MQKSQHTKKYRRLLEALRETRKKAGLTQTEVSKRLGSYSTFITKLESGERRVDVIELTELCHIYGVKLQVFLKAANID